MNTFGRNLRLTTFGESHGPAVGGVLDGFPAGIKIDFDLILREMEARRPGGKGVSTRQEPDMPEFLSGISTDGYSLGTPIGFIIKNKDTRSNDYNLLENAYRPNHADYTYMRRYGIRDHRGGGRASARETACRVVGGALALHILTNHDIRVRAFLTGVGKVGEENLLESLSLNPELASGYEPSEELKVHIMVEVEKARMEKDSIGGTVSCMILNMPPGIGNPIYDKLSARLAEAMMGINAAKGFEIGYGTASAGRKGSEVLDRFEETLTGQLYTRTNYSGGLQGGISNGMPIFFNVSFKPTPTIGRPIPIMTDDGKEEIVTIPGRHDPCVAVRAVSVVKAMAALTVADLLLTPKLETHFKR